MTSLARSDLDLDFFTRDRLFLGGEWCDPASSRRIDIVDPTTEEVLGSVPEATVGDVDRAIAAAVEAFGNSPWRTMSYADRAKHLVRLADEIEARAADVALAYVYDFGGPVRGGQAMGAFAATQLRAHVDLAAQLTDGPERVTTGNIEALLVREPIGPVLAVVPWNSTHAITVVKLASALLAGCPIVVKTAVESPMGAFVLADAIEAAGIPKGMVSFLPGNPETLGGITRRPEFGYISFTGSTASGVTVMKDAAENLTKVGLELGGKSAAVILDDLDPAEHAALLVAGTMGQSGQICMTYSRLLVPRAKEAAWREALAALYAALPLGDAADPTTVIGPLATAAHRDRVLGYIQSARDEGATILSGGGRPASRPTGYFVEPTLVADVTPDMRVVREEVFGPVITVQAYDTEEEAIAMANSSEYGLAAGVFTLSEDRAIPIALALEAGSVSVNLSGACYRLPVGGYKRSGIGREGGLAGIEELLEWKQVQLRRLS